MGEAEFQEQLALAKRIEEQLEKAVPVPNVEAGRATFLISSEDGKSISACSKGDERAALEWLMQSIHGVFAASGTDPQSSIRHLEAVRATFLTSAPKTPVEALILGQLMVSHEMVTQFAAKALRTNDSVIAGRLAERAARFMDTTLRQAEVISKLRGEIVQQRVIVQHNYLADGSQAVIGATVQGGDPPSK